MNIQTSIKEEDVIYLLSVYSEELNEAINNKMWRKTQELSSIILKLSYLMEVNVGE
jgi:hypothetical protein